ncbi:MAG: lyase family protein [Chlamydiales bacterium]
MSNIFEKSTIPEDVYYGKNTEEGRLNFSVSGIDIWQYPLLLNNLALLKKAAAMANVEIAMLSKKVGEAICMAADEIIAGKLSRNNFPVDILQGGGCITMNMNMNEVIASRANEILTGNKKEALVDPNNHVNMCQSTNDIIPTVMQLTLHGYISELLKSMSFLKSTLKKKVEEFKDVVKASHTCLQEAVPITLGQEFSTYLVSIEDEIAELERFAETCLSLPLGGTATGTGLGTHKGYLEIVYRKLNELTQLPVKPTNNFLAAFQNPDFYLKISALLRAIAMNLLKIGKDFRVYASGGRSGRNELLLPASLKMGSTIMPGKVNPVQPELLMQIAFQVYGNDAAVSLALAHIEPDLNVWESIIIKCLLESLTLMTKGIFSFVKLCLTDTVANVEKCYEYAENTLAISVAISEIYGYEAGKRVTAYAVKNNMTIKKASVELGLLNELFADKLLDPLMLTDQEKSTEIISIMSDKQKKNIENIILSIHLEIRLIILRSIIYILQVAAESEKKEINWKEKYFIIVKTISDALIVKMSDEDIYRLMEERIYHLESIRGLETSQNELVYVCAYWCATTIFLEETTRKEIKEELKKVFDISSEREQFLNLKVEKIRERDAQYTPLSETLVWLEKFSLLLVSMLEFTGLNIKELSYKDKIFNKIDIDKSEIKLLTNQEREIVKNNLYSNEVGVVIYALKLIEDIDYEVYLNALSKLLLHPIEAVKIEVLRRIEKESLNSFIPLIQAILAKENSSSVIALMLRTLAANDDKFLQSDSMRYLQDENFFYRAAIITGLLKSYNIEKMHFATGQLLELTKSKNRNDTLLLCEILGESNKPELSQNLLTILNEEDINIKNAALIAMGKLNEPTLYPHIIFYLTDPNTREAAIKAIATIGAPILSSLESVFSTCNNRSVIRNLLRIYRVIKSESVIHFLAKHLDYSDISIRTDILILLNSKEYIATGLKKNEIFDKIHREINQIILKISRLLILERAEKFSLLCKSIKRSILLSKIRLLCYLSFIYPKDTIELFWNAVLGNINKSVDLSINDINKILPSKILDILLVLFRNITLSECFDRLTVISDTSYSPSIRQALEDIWNDSFWYCSWTRACVLYEVSRLNVAILSELNIDRNFMRLEKGEEKSMLLEIEKVLFLKGTEMFSEAPDEVIYSIVSDLEERSLKAGEIIIKKGAIENYMFFVVKGTVKVWLKENSPPIFLGRYQSVGELSLIDDDPRSADVISEEETTILILDKPKFHQIISCYPEVGLGLMRTLSRRLKQCQSSLG